jgi:hypothetical protein
MPTTSPGDNATGQTQGSRPLKGLCLSVTDHFVSPRSYCIRGISRAPAVRSEWQVYPTDREMKILFD